MRIRRATLGDSPHLARIQVDSYRTAYAGLLPQPYLDHFTYEDQEQDWRDLLSSGGEDLLYVAETDTGQIVGYALGRHGPAGISAYDGELLALHVRPAYQRQGLGQELLAAVARQLEQSGSTSLLLWVLEGNPVRALYERLGGQVLGERDWVEESPCRFSVKEVAYGWPDIGTLSAPTDRDPGASRS
jgi:ribosomal protein S18 acetylase RimI-like enzyme